jgi:glucose/mannose-6-phosphate isomerase
VDYSILKKYDPSGMHLIYDKWPEMARESFSSDLGVCEFKDISNIVFAGMGGSGTVGDVFSAILSKTGMCVDVTKGYHLPPTANSKTLVIATSISGNTVETLSVLDIARKLNCKTIAFSSEGRIQEYCGKHGLEYRKISQSHSPRASFVSFFYSMAKVLGDTLSIKKSDVLESIKILEWQQSKINSSVLDEKNPALEIASWINGIPLIYYPWGLQAVAIRFKNSLQENAKTHVITEDIIEACHNGIVSWQRPSNIVPFLIQGQDDYFKTKERWKIIKEFFDLKKIEYREIFSTKGSIMTKIMGLIYLLDYSTIYKAVLLKIDPSQIRPLDFVKSRL